MSVAMASADPAMSIADAARRRDFTINAIAWDPLGPPAASDDAYIDPFHGREDLERKRLVQLMSKTKLPSDWFRLVWRTGHARELELRQIAGELCELPLR